MRMFSFHLGVLDALPRAILRPKPYKAALRPAPAACGYSRSGDICPSGAAWWLHVAGASASLPAGQGGRPIVGVSECSTQGG